MYEQHFGLQKHPFTARASGADVFVGPQTAATMAGMKKALQSQDAVIVVSGPAGSGKSTLVGKALDAVSGTHRSVRIGRMSLDGADALEFLLEELGVTELPRGTIRQFAALREKLGQLQSQGTRLVIVIEDAIRTGIDTMAEFEALTAADAGASAGAAIIVMGDERLAAFLRDPQLARLAQRVRQRQEIAPLSAAELRGYLVHCFRRAGREFQEIFDPDAAVVIHDLCNGNPRLSNNLVDAVLAAAAASNLSPVSGKFIAEVGSNQLGLVASNRTSSERPPASASAPASTPEVTLASPPTSTPKSDPESTAEPAPELADARVDETEPAAGPDTAEALTNQPEPEEQRDPVIVFSDEPRNELLDDEEIPDLIQDTLPDLEVLAPEVIERETLSESLSVSGPEPGPEVEPQPPVEQEAAEQLPAAEQEEALEPSLVAASAADDVPEWDRDPTMAELKPDLDALEKAMAFAHGDGDEGEPPVLEPLTKAMPEPPAAAVEEIPEITLDNAIQARIESSRVEAPAAVGAAGDDTPAAKARDVPEVQLPASDANKADKELERIAAELARAKTIEDVDDKLAETLFGEEFSLVAAQVAASLSADTSANDSELSFDSETATGSQAADAPVDDSPVEDSPVDDRAPPDAPAVEVSLETHHGKNEGGLDLSASQRLRTVRALNADAHTQRQEKRDDRDPGPDAAARADGTPDPIEDQINISMTQTLRALNVRPPVSDQEADAASDENDAEEKTGGFFSRFRRS